VSPRSEPLSYYGTILPNILRSFTGAVLTRFFLGIVEGKLGSNGQVVLLYLISFVIVAAFFPGALFLLSKWYVTDIPSCLQAGALKSRRWQV
jgi:hypothetical protein